MANQDPYDAPQAQVDAGQDHEPEKYSTLKKVLMIIGGLFVVGALALAVTIGVLFMNGSKLDQSSKAYADTAIVAVITDWNQAELESRFSPEFKASLKEGDLAKWFAIYKKLGKLKSYNGSQGQANMSVTAAKGKVISASYVGKAEFETGPGEILLTLIEHDGQWQVYGFRVHSEQFMIKP